VKSGRHIHPSLSALTKIDGTATSKGAELTRDYANPRVSLRWNVPPHYSTTKGKFMRSKFNKGDKVIINGKYYPAHSDHIAMISDTSTKNRSMDPTPYVGTRKIYSVWCSCGAKIKPKAEHMTLHR
jgi:hypothetical protein